MLVWFLGLKGLSLKIFKDNQSNPGCIDNYLGRLSTKNFRIEVFSSCRWILFFLDISWKDIFFISLEACAEISNLSPTKCSFQIHNLFWTTEKDSWETNTLNWLTPQELTKSYIYPSDIQYQNYVLILAKADEDEYSVAWKTDSVDYNHLHIPNMACFLTLHP